MVQTTLDRSTLWEMHTPQVPPPSFPPLAVPQCLSFPIQFPVLLCFSSLPAFPLPSPPAQIVKPDLLRRGFEFVKANNAIVTDDASIIEALEEPVRITKGHYTNLKITTPEDMLLAERILDERTAATEP